MPMHQDPLLVWWLTAKLPANECRENLAQSQSMIDIWMGNLYGHQRNNSTGTISISPVTVIQVEIGCQRWSQLAPDFRVENTLQWRHNGRDGVLNYQPRDCLLNRLFRRRSKKTSKLRVTGLCAGNSPMTGEFPAQMTSNAEMFPFDGVIMVKYCSTNHEIWALCIWNHRQLGSLNTN